MSLPANILGVTSTVTDGSMSTDVSDVARLENRRKFLARYDITADQSVLVRLKYEGDDYRRYLTVSNDQAGDGVVRESTMTADALFTASKNLALVLPIADCIGAVLYDSKQEVIGLSHFGRHNLVQQGGSGTIEYMARHYGSQPKEIKIWLSPSAGPENYPLFDFDNRSLVEVASEQLLAAGVLPDNIEIDTRDTTMDNGLFSHSEFLKGRRTSDGRQMIVAMMRL